MNNKIMNSCRICLEEGASNPIFNFDEVENIYNKLSLCMREKIEDIEGYPRNICDMCVETLETVCNFVNKYKESTKILENQVIGLKTENVYFDFYCENDNNSEVDVEIDAIKTEPKDFDEVDDNQPLTEVIPLTKHTKSERKLYKSRTNKEIAKIKANKEITIKRVKSQSKHKTNKIVSSLLEGEFTWIGDKWCLMKKRSQNKFQTEPVKTKIPQKTSREIKLKIPKIKQPDPPKLCDLCGEIFNNQEKLTHHKRKVHFSSPVKCPECPRTLVSEYYLHRHIKRTHRMVKDFVCSVCGAAFAFSGELSHHNRQVHNKHLIPKKVYTCKICDKKYKCSKSVIVHERSVHTGQRPAECSICGSRFYHVDYLKEHMRLHTGETPFKCPICGRGYAQRGNMKSHLRIHRLAEINDELMSKIKPSYLKLLKDFR